MITKLKYSDNTSASSTNIEPINGMLSVYAKKKEVQNLRSLAYFAGVKIVEFKVDPLRPSMASLLLNFNERVEFEPFDLSSILKSHQK